MNKQKTAKVLQWKQEVFVMKIKSTRIWIAGDFMPGVIEISGESIVSVLPYETQADIDYGDLRIVPGFIDIHCHGAYGFDTNYANEEGLKKWTKNIVHEGVTGFLATTITEMKPVLTKAVENVAKVHDENRYEGARILGIHFEGPYLDMAKKGAQPAAAIVPPSVEEFKEYQKAAHNLIKVITLAPEHDKDFALTRYASTHGTVVSMGHTSATYEQAMMAVANGASSITHTYNAMSPFNHRQNGMVGAALRLHDLYSEVICDCNHSTPEALNIFFREKDSTKAIMISDALMCKGYPVGTKFEFGGQGIVIYPDGSAHLIKEGNLAGSTMKTNEGLRNLVERALVPFDKALNSCTCNPAALLHMDDHLGYIKVGYDASITILNDDYSVASCFVEGIKQF
jgi:N-acetylglucosamine-6-phosphate deacetylase